MRKVLRLMYGLPGSGKSEKIKNCINISLSVGQQDSIVISTDDLWKTQYNTDSNYYLFDKESLGLAHTLNKCKVDCAMKHNFSIIYVDNTNLTWQECRPYCELAKKHIYTVSLIQPDTEWRDDAFACFRKCNHNVPLDTILRCKEHRAPFIALQDQIEDFMKGNIE